MFRSVLRTQLRHQSTGSTRKVTVRDLFRTPVFKSVVLTVVFGASVIEYMKARKELESLESTFGSQHTILTEIYDKLKAGQKVDVQQELKIANTITRYKYSMTDIEFEDQLEQFLKEAENPHQNVNYEYNEPNKVKDVRETKETKSEDGSVKRDSKKFL